eukprot:403347761
MSSKINNSQIETPSNSIPLQQEESFFQSFKNVLSSKTFAIVTGTALATIVLYGIYNNYRRAELTQEEKLKQFVKKELQRLKNPQLIDDGILTAKDFFDMILLIQLKSKMKLQRELPRNQRERVKLLNQALQDNHFDQYFDKTKYFMESEFQNYEDQFLKIMNKIGITQECWDASQRTYINSDGYYDGDESEQKTIKSIEKKSYEFMPVYSLGRTLTKDKTKSIMIDANNRAFNILKTHFADWAGDEGLEFQPLLFETLAFDFVFIDHGIQENIFRYATHKYDLSNDQEIKETLDEYLSS